MYCMFTIEATKTPDSVHPLHPISLALHCILILSKCIPQFRSALGESGVIWQFVKNLRSMQMIPGWNKVPLNLPSVSMFHIIVSLPICMRYAISGGCTKLCRSLLGTHSGRQKKKGDVSIPCHSIKMETHTHSV